MPEPTIALFGAIDRFNYGDLLFPLLLKRALETAGADPKSVRAVGLRASDLSAHGALPTLPLHWLKEPDKLPDGSSVIVAGGEVLGASWGRLLSHLLPQNIGDPIYKTVSRLVPETRLDRLGQLASRSPWPVPFAPRPHHFANRVQTLFNAVGGSGLPRRPEIWQREVRSALGEAAFASVRDQPTFDAAAVDGVLLAPDSAAAMADFFPAADLLADASPDVRRLVESGSPYLCFQLHRYFTAAKLTTFAAGLDTLQSDTGMAVVLLPIGRAAGHSDQWALRKVRSTMRTQSTLPGDAGVFDIMALLAHCSLYAGTSLHGLITAMAHARPYATIGKNPKCAAFLDAWAPAELRPRAQAKSLVQTLASRADTPRSTLIESAETLRHTARAGLDTLVATTLNPR